MLRHKLEQPHRRKLRRIQDALDDPHVSKEHKERIREEVDEIHAMLARQSSENAFEAFLVQFLNDRIKDATEADDICGCSLATCPLKNGELPPELRHHGRGRFDRQDAQTELADYLRGHPQATVLRDAKKAWDSAQGDVISRIDRVLAATKKLNATGDQEVEVAI